MKTEYQHKEALKRCRSFIDPTNPETWRKSKYCTNRSPVYVSDNMTAKLAGVPAISTTCLCNDRCKARMENGTSICSHCFAEATAMQYNNLLAHLKENTNLLSTRLLTNEEIPLFKVDVEIVRFEAFGDLTNIIHYANFARIAEMNPHVKFALWSKNPDYIGESIVYGAPKPENLTIIYSSHVLNFTSTKAMNHFGFIDKIFTVFDAKTIENENITINCGARSCYECRRCYDVSGDVFINEKLK